MSIEAHQCPYCELRFATQWELKLHIASDHPDRDPDENPDEDEE
ncbi:MAG: C2H2-type zinc finger protein [Acidimicrobiia bacterium]